MAQKPVLRGEVGARALRVRCACGQCREGKMGERGCARRLGEVHFIRFGSAGGEMCFMGKREALIGLSSNSTNAADWLIIDERG